MANEQRPKRQFAQVYDAVELINQVAGDWGDIVTIELDTLGFLKLRFDATVIGHAE